MSYGATSLTVAVASSTSVTVAWSVTSPSPPTFNWSLTLSGSGTISGTASGTGTTSTSGSITVTGLPKGTAYGGGQSNTVQLNLSGGAGSSTIAPSNNVTTPFDITWNLDGGTGGSGYTYTVAPGGTLSAPTATPTKTGYGFNGWSPSLPKTITADTTITATWLPYYTITYALAGGTGGSGYQTSVLSGQTVAAPSSNPTYSGKTFNGWSPSLPQTNVTSNLTFTATWTPNRVTWNYNGGSGTPAYTDVAYGGTTTTPIAGRTNYDFVSWTGNGQTLAQGATTSVITVDVQYDANWNYNPPPTYPPAWTDNTLASFQASVSYSDGVSATNMSYSGSYSVSAGSLPTGISLNTSTGAVTGTPTTGGQAYSFTLQATNTYSSTSVSFSGNVGAAPTYPPAWTDSVLGSFQASVAYSDGVSATNMSYSGSYSVSVGSLPTGISLNTATGAVTGTPTVGSQAYSFTLQATNTYGSVTVAFSGTVAAAPAYPPAWTDSVLGPFTVGRPYSDAVAASSMSYSGAYSVSAGSLPTGVSLNTSTGAVIGTPTVTGSYSFTLTATNTYGSVSQAFSGTIQGGMFVYNGSAWIKGPAKVYNGSAWVLGTAYVYNGTSWVVSN